jgi:hypothetical protein
VLDVRCLILRTCSGQQAERATPFYPALYLITLTAAPLDNDIDRLPKDQHCCHPSATSHQRCVALFLRDPNSKCTASQRLDIN